MVLRPRSDLVGPVRLMLSPSVMHFFVDSGSPTFLAIVIKRPLLAVYRGHQRRSVTTVFQAVPVADHTTLGPVHHLVYALDVSSPSR